MFNAEFNNVACFEERKGINGWYLARFPEALRSKLGSVGPLAAEESSCLEIRFVTDATMIRLSVTNLEPNSKGANLSKVHVYKGDFLKATHTLERGVINQIEVMSFGGFGDMPEENLYNNYFSPNVWRFVFVECTPMLHEINTYGFELRPPTAQEKPKLKMLSYGSSITHHGSEIDGYSYVHHAARRLKVDILGKGTGGSCFCDNGMADFFTNECEWDFATLELGVNMIGSFETEEFRSRVAYMLKTLSAKHPQKHIWAIDIFSNYFDYDSKLIDSEAAIRQRAFRETVKEEVARINSTYVHYLPGREVQPDLDGLSADFLHPSFWGHQKMGERLAEVIQRVL